MNEDLLKEYFHAARLCDFKGVMECLNKGVDVNYGDPINTTLLHIATMLGDLEFLERCLSIEGINVNVASGLLSFPAIYHAARGCNYAKCELLLKHNADVNACSWNDVTILHQAVMNRNMPLVRLFVNYRADVNAIDVYSRTPLSISIIDIRDEAIASFLLQNGADPNMRRPFCLPLLSDAVIHCSHDLEILALLLNAGADPNSQDIHGRTPLHYAVLQNDIAIIVLFKFYTKDLDFKDIDNKTPVDIAMRHGNYKLLQHFNSKATPTSSTIVRT